MPLDFCSVEARKEGRGGEAIGEECWVVDQVGGLGHPGRSLGAKLKALEQRQRGQEAHTAVDSLNRGRERTVQCVPYHITTQISQATLRDLFLLGQVTVGSQLSCLMNNVRAEFR